MKKEFSRAAALSLATEVSFCPFGEMMEPVEWMAGPMLDITLRHEWVRRGLQAGLRSQVPNLASVEDAAHIDKTNYAAFLANEVEKYGPTVSIEQGSMRPATAIH